MEKRPKSARKKKKKVVKKPTEISFKQFFERCVREGKLKPWQEKEVELFFRDMKLKPKEDLDTYQEMLKKY